MLARPQLKLEITLILTEEEAQALAKITEWSVPDTIKGIGTTLHGCEMKDITPGLETFLFSCRKFIPDTLEMAKKSRRAFLEQDPHILTDD